MTEKKAANFLDFIPSRSIDWAQDEAGKVYLIKEKTKNKVLKKIISWVNKNQNFHIHLDDLGTSAWLAIDGKRSVNDICGMMKEKFGEKLVQPEKRLSFFLGT
ncbi:MAG: PqqD family protein, partial [bacterium]|nr:PqqD family protein [bacterium]